MNIRTLLISTVMTTTMLNALPALAQSASVANDNSASAQQLQKTSSEILGNISIANTALAYGFNDDALSHINAARQAISAMNGQMAQADTSVPMTAGKVTYKTLQGESDYWIPVVNDRFVVRSFDGKHLMSRQPDIDVTDAQSIHYKLFLDTKVADEQLAQAQTAIAQKKYDVAMNDLQGISKGAMSEMVAEDRPMVAVRDNLVLARELLKDKDYRGASFALKHANTELARVEKESPGTADNAYTKDMQSQITSLQATIAKDNPSDLKMAETKIDGWIKDIKAKIEKL